MTQLALRRDSATMRAVRVQPVAVLCALMLLGAQAQSRQACPTPSRQWARSNRTSRPTKPPSPDAQYVGRVRELFVIDHSGMVCRTEILESLNSDADQAANSAVQKWRFNPTFVYGRPVSVFTIVDFFYWRQPNAKVVATHTTVAQQTASE